ncbi:MAG: metallophosphoesterase family protein [Candidatus Margulisiibacteriota bacterium]|nr:metallophosphoesterase family protein [Candidatus Margulisiibacteriota bacterium]
MLYGIISDIHSNLEALNAVLDKLKNVDQVVNLGDVVGYGPNPNECVEEVRKLNLPTVAGNHDKAVTTELDASWFNKSAKEAVQWTQRVIFQENLECLKKLPLVIGGDEFQAVHGSLRSPLEEYITGIADAMPTFEKMTRNLCFVGHSHRPLYIARLKNGNYAGHSLKEGEEVVVDDFDKIIINVGGVGQPRDGDPRACYGTYNSKTRIFTLHRVEYDVEAVQEKMRAAKLPENLIDRLKFGR